MTTAADRRTSAVTKSTAELVRRIRAEYEQMPGLKLSLHQARRLWSVDEATCEGVLAALVDARFLRRSSKGLFVMAPPASATQMSGVDWKASEVTPFHSDSLAPSTNRWRRQARSTTRWVSSKSA